ncbi:RICIN domain-containing protein [Actinacidiphila acidipaludis]|uniref:RICIN domain-containing protein n=1 Tax=Actinacidiphila acidipaludis TaxID=2873382 RepID=A0ABS7Q573_9ACTN|nr:RICIN domain-containing protein [Streptomyces acidipaludis]MBY8877996.1 RICIN domain-containing protein [Streptomyces acidipaludis]
MRTRSLLSLTAATAALLFPAAPAHAAGTGTYRIQLAGTNRCLAASEGLIGGALRVCGPSTVWTVRAMDDGTVQFVEPAGEGRCLGLSPAVVFPPALWLSTCGASPDRWRVEVTDGSSLVALALDDAPFGTLTSIGNRAAAAGDGAAEWLVRPVDSAEQ